MRSPAKSNKMQNTPGKALIIRFCNVYLKWGDQAFQMMLRKMSFFIIILGDDKKDPKTCFFYILEETVDVFFRFQFLPDSWCITCQITV